VLVVSARRPALLPSSYTTPGTRPFFFVPSSLRRSPTLLDSQPQICAKGADGKAEANYYAVIDDLAMIG
jgi:hypothetical protein